MAQTFYKLPEIKEIGPIDLKSPRTLKRLLIPHTDRSSSQESLIGIRAQLQSAYGTPRKSKMKN
jgi:hypothetical protein